MLTDELKRKITDFREIGLPDYVPRTGTVHTADRTVSTIIGARRTGKSFRALQCADELIRNGHLRSPDHVCHIDFDNPILAECRAPDLQTIPDVFLSLTPDAGPRTSCLFIFDEIHKVSGWEEFVVDLSRNPRWRVIVTGSSSRLLHRDISTVLRGKAVSTIQYPLSFAEFMGFHEKKVPATSSRGRADARCLFEEYLTWGGFPVLPSTDMHSRETVLHGYFDAMMFKDIIQRNNAGNPRHCLQLYRYLLANMGKPFTQKSAYSYLRQNGAATSRDSVREYLAWAEDAWLLFAVPVYSASLKQQERNYKKLYCIDWGLAIRNSLAWDGSFSRALENMIYLQLRRSYPRTFYYLTRKDRQEVDFISLDSGGRPVLAAQVCQDISHPDTLRRELAPLFAAAEYFGTETNLLITRDREETFRQGTTTVRAVPAWQWLLEETNL